jgi:hypothetical protein
MGRKRKADLEVEYELERKVRDLRQEVSKLKKLLREKEKTDKVEKKPKTVEKTGKDEGKSCPKCGAAVRVSKLPMGYLELCSSACGHRMVTKANNKEGVNE